MRIRQFRTPDLAAVYAATLIENVISREPHPVLGLATGSTPIGVYRQLVDFHRQGLSFRHVTTINLDEYVGLGGVHPQSYRNFMNETLFDQIDIPRDQTHVPNGMAPDLEEECRRYDAVVDENPIDFQLLGIGRNGHVGFNEPSVSLMARTHVIRLSEDTISANARFFGCLSDVPTRAITMGMQSILRARSIVLLAFGRDKARVIRQTLSGEVSTEVPASLLQMHQDVTFVLDAEAASELDSTTVEGQLHSG